MDMLITKDFLEGKIPPIFFNFHKGFAVSLQVILSNPKAVFKRRGSQPGMQESDFLKQITTVEELEPKASNCTKVFISLVPLDLAVCPLRATRAA